MAKQSGESAQPDLSQGVRQAAESTLTQAKQAVDQFESAPAAWLWHAACSDPCTGACAYRMETRWRSVRRHGPGGRTCAP